MFRTEITTRMEIRCVGCESPIPLDFSFAGRRAIHVQCPHCEAHQRVAAQSTSCTDLLAIIGVRVSLDWDGQLIVTSATPLSPELDLWITRCQPEIRSHLTNAGRLAQAVFVGGPLSGQPHGCGYGGPPGERVLRHISRARWAVYTFRDWEDARVFFVGEATSKKKARQLTSGETSA